MIFFENLPSIVFKTLSVPLLGDRNLPYVKEGSTSHLGLLPSGKKRETALLDARNRDAIRLADHQRSSPSSAGWDRLGLAGASMLLLISRLAYLYQGEKGCWYMWDHGLR